MKIAIVVAMSILLAILPYCPETATPQAEWAVWEMPPPIKDSPMSRHSIEEPLPTIAPTPSPLPTATPAPSPSPAPTATPAPTTTEAMRYVGVFRITAYCPCVKCCGKSDGVTASGKIAAQGSTVAADPKLFKYGTRLYIEGVGERIVEDCGGFRGMQLDLFFDSHQVALQWGVRQRKVWVIK